jgi:hypothetical protein
MKRGEKMNKTAIVLIGALLFIVVMQAVQLSQSVRANQSPQNGMNHGHMNCMSMTLEEMDNNNDGKCDMCDMSISECKEMMEEHENMEEHHGMMGMNGMSCHM